MILRSKADERALFIFAPQLKFKHQCSYLSSASNNKKYIREDQKNL